MKKKLLSILLAALLVVSILPTVAFAEGCEHTFVDGKCTACGADDHDHSHTDWTAWGDNDNEKTKLPTATGNYYLVADVTLDGNHYVESGNDVVLCLNGYVVDCNNKTFNIGTNDFDEKPLANLTICDCNTTAKHSGHLATDGHWVWDQEAYTPTEGETEYDIAGGVIYQSAYTSIYNGHFTLNGGTIAGTVASVYPGSFTIQTAHKNAAFVMNGGAIVGNVSQSGTVYVTYDTATFTMNGGRISDNRVTDSSSGKGGGVYVGTGYFTMNGGEISRNSAKNGGGIAISPSGATAAAKLHATLKGGVICDNTASSMDGGVYTSRDDTQLELGGTIKIYGNKVGTEEWNLGGTDVWQAPLVALATGENKPAPGMVVGVYCRGPAAPDVMTSSGATEEDLKYFFTDYATACMIYEDGKLEIGQIPSGNSKITVVPSEGGVVYAPQYAASEAEVTLTAVPDDGYELKGYTVTDAEDAPVEVKDNKFAMPNKAVTVTADFVEKDPYSGSAQIEVEVPELNPEYTIHIPANTTLDYGKTEKQALTGSVYITGVKDFKENQFVECTISGDNLKNGDKTLETTYSYDTTSAEGDDVSFICNEGESNGTAIYAQVADWSGAVAGKYTATVSFAFSLVEPE